MEVTIRPPSNQVELPCTASGIPQPAVHWLKEGDPTEVPTMMMSMLMLMLLRSMLMMMLMMSMLMIMMSNST